MSTWGLNHFDFESISDARLFFSLTHLMNFCPILHSVYRVVNVGILVLVVMWFALDTAQRGIRQVVSFFGLLMLVLVMHLFSKHPFRVRHSTPTVIVRWPNAFRLAPHEYVLFVFDSVVLEMFDVGHRNPVHHGPDHTQDPCRRPGTAVVGGSSRGTPCSVDHLANSQC